jgi:hypothetical protein
MMLPCFPAADNCQAEKVPPRMAAWMLLQLRLSVFDGQDGVLRSKTPMPKSAMEGGFWHAQGIGAVSFFAAGKKDTSVKPGPAA